jgi:hypothetical protein
VHDEGDRVCFSATASFTAGVTLSAVGALTIAKVKRRAELPFAAIPLLFGIQQIVEGFVWLSFSHHAPELRQTMTYIYSVFSHVLWPIYVPLAFLILETTPCRRKVMLGFQLAGLTVGLYLLYAILTTNVVAKVESHHLVYDSPHFFIGPVIVLYLASTCFTGTFSSHLFVRLFGGLALPAFLASYLFAEYALISVWCFFAAILSLLIYLHLRYRRFGGFPQTGSPPEAPSGLDRLAPVRR